MNRFIKKDTGDSRLLILPMVPDHGVRYLWGYRGDEPSPTIFGRSTISKDNRAKYSSEKYKELFTAFEQKKDFSSILEDLNVGYVIVNYDVDYKAVGAISPDTAKKLLVDNTRIEYVDRYGNLWLYRFAQKNPGLFVSDPGVAQVAYQKLSPSNYLVQVRDASDPFTLVFKETYHDLWNATVDGQKLTDHYVWGGYANAWKIDKLGSYTINIHFKVWPWN